MNPSEIKNRIREYILTETLKNVHITIEDETSLIEGGLIDSYALVRAAMHLEEDFGISISGEELMVANFDSIQAMAEIVIQKLAENETSDS
jgi:acyl carrier protein